MMSVCGSALLSFLHCPSSKAAAMFSGVLCSSGLQFVTVILVLYRSLTSAAALPVLVAVLLRCYCMVSFRGCLGFCGPVDLMM